MGKNKNKQQERKQEQIKKKDKSNVWEGTAGTQVSTDGTMVRTTMPTQLANNGTQLKKLDLNNSACV